MTGYYLRQPLNILSCAVAGRPGRSAYQQAVDAGYTGSLEEYSALLASLPEAMTRLNVYNGRVDAILEYLGSRVSALEIETAALKDRVAALEGG
ncbi:MAG: hypothetical protein IKS05_09710 [Oscillospiraceae bacterium]|nr:hypothetical protein [Oscillospiraceae bacterium]